MATNEHMAADPPFAMGRHITKHRLSLLHPPAECRLCVSINLGEFNMSIQSKGATLASLAAVMALSMSAAVAAEKPAGSSGMAVGASDKVHCYGVTSCKGTSDCKTAENSCKGMNACKGHGFKAMQAKECLKSDGVIADLKN
jgi:uncharacterized membrane protein